MTAVFLDGRLFDVEPLCDQPSSDGGFALRMARRVVLLAWLYAGGPRYELSKAELLPFIERASAYWRARGHALFDSTSPATIVCVLFQLQALGPVLDFSEAPGGFHVQLAEPQS
jgi:hypothetical protein